MPRNDQRAGALRDRVLFQRRGDMDDGFGTVIPGAGPFETAIDTRAAFRPLRGGETVQASRLQGRQPYVVTVRNQPALADVTTAWRLVDARNPNRIFAVVGPVTDPDGTNAWREVLVTEGAPS